MTSPSQLAGLGAAEPLDDEALIAQSGPQLEEWIRKLADVHGRVMSRDPYNPNRQDAARTLREALNIARQLWEMRKAYASGEPIDHGEFMALFDQLKRHVAAILDETYQAQLHAIPRPRWPKPEEPGFVDRALSILDNAVLQTGRTLREAGRAGGVLRSWGSAVIFGGVIIGGLLLANYVKRT